jgi:hypothetical protein
MFHVRWARVALNELTNLWLAADPAERLRITSATHSVEQRLRRDPRNEGESRSRGRRITFEAPLTFIFRVEPDGRTVSVLHVRLFRSRRP